MKRLNRNFNIHNLDLILKTFRDQKLENESNKQIEELKEDLTNNNSLLKNIENDFIPENTIVSKGNNEKSILVSSDDSPCFPRSNSNFFDCIPNIYQKYRTENDPSVYSDKKRPIKDHFLKIITEDFSISEFNDLSQKMSSISISDQLLLESIRILTEISHTEKNSIFSFSFCNSKSNENKSFNFLNASREVEDKTLNGLNSFNFNQSKIETLYPLSKCRTGIEEKDESDEEEENLFQLEIKAKKKNHEL